METVGEDRHSDPRCGCDQSFRYCRSDNAQGSRRLGTQLGECLQNTDYRTKKPDKGGGRSNDREPCQPFGRDTYSI